MFSHVMIGANDIEASRRFYDASLGALGVPPGFLDPLGRVIYTTPKGTFIVTKPIDGEPASHANGGTIGFAADSGEMADGWHAAGLANGGTACEDPPGPRANGDMIYYLAYLRDPAGNKLVAMHVSPAG